MDHLLLKIFPIVAIRNFKLSVIWPEETEIWMTWLGFRTTFNQKIDLLMVPFPTNSTRPLKSGLPPLKNIPAGKYSDKSVNILRIFVEYFMSSVLKTSSFLSKASSNSDSPTGSRGTNF
jgi:hypothetical protein